MTQQFSAAAIITAGGFGRRMGSSTPKQYLTLDGCPIIIYSIKAFLSTQLFKQIILTVPVEHLDETQVLLTSHKLDTLCEIIPGGKTRQESVHNGLEKVDSEITHVAVHDGVRPLIQHTIISTCLEAAYKSGAAITAIRVKDTLKLSTDTDDISKTVERTNLWRAQTPQIAKKSLLKDAYQQASELNFTGTDEASLLELIDCPVKLVEGSENNIKITLPEDIAMAEAILTAQERHSTPAVRTGHGFDAHQLVENRSLVLGGVTIPHSKGLLGHSDADVLTHALCDAVLGALAEGDIGQHFPDTDDRYKNINSLELLRKVMELCEQKQFILGNADITLVAQQPKVAPYLEQMKNNISDVCRIDSTSVNIKATTSEKMGFTGRGEGMSCHAVVLLLQVPK